jgi:hypothetical protein
MTLERMKELFGITHVRDDEEEVPSAKCMALGKRVSRCHSPYTAVLPIAVPPQEEGVLASLLSQSMTRATMMKALYRPC